MLIRSSNGVVGTTPPASRRDSAGWVMPARVAQVGLGQAQGQAAFPYRLADQERAAGLGVSLAVLVAAARHER